MNQLGNLQAGCTERLDHQMMMHILKTPNTHDLSSWLKLEDDQQEMAELSESVCELFH